MIKRNLPLMITLGVFVLGYLYCLTQFPGFASTRVICNILTDNAFLGIIAVGMTFVIISGGINISPVELEIAIGAIDGVQEVAVIAAHDDRFGETPAAIVTASPDVDEKAVIEHCEKVLADFKVPRYVVIRQDPLPRLPSGKLAKTVIRDEYKDVDTRFDKVR